MKTSCPALPIAIALVAAIPVAPPAAAQVPGAPAAEPERFNAEPYSLDSFSNIWSKSPFAFEIVVDGETEEGPGPFDDLALMGFSQEGDVYYATLFNQKDLKGPRVVVNTAGPNEDGYKLVRVERGSTYKETRVLIEKGGESDFIGYDEKRLATKPTGAVGGQNPVLARNQNQQQQQQALQAQLQQQQQQQQQGQQPGGIDQGGARTLNPAAAANNNAQQSRNEVIQRLLERARQNQENANVQGQGQGQGEGRGQNRGGDTQRRRRVVLPPAATNR
jgi:hypothetical protein